MSQNTLQERQVAFQPAPVQTKGVPAWVAAVPVVLVNTVAFFGQYAFLVGHVQWPTPGRVLFAVALESIAVYLAWHAHVAQLNNDSSTRLKLGAILFAALMGAMNYSHYAGPHWHPTFMAVGMFCMSSLSPWLWGIHSRRASRNTLMERGLIEEHAVRLGANRWSWHPARSAQVMFHSTWHGINEPKRAIALYEERRAARAARRNARRAGRRNDGAGTPVPDAQAAAAVQATVHAPAQIIAGTQLNGKLVAGSAALGAAATLNYQPPTAEKVAEVRELLIAMPADDRPAAREVARMLGHENNQRRKAKDLLQDAALADVEAARTVAHAATGSPAAPRPVNGRTPVQIAAPAGTLPGGVTA